MSNANAFVNAALGGWGVEGVTTLQSGFPLHLTTNSNTSNSFGGGQRPNVVAGCNSSVSGSITSKLNDYFNTACFTQPAPFTFGDESRNDPHLRAPGIANWDFSAFKASRSLLRTERLYSSARSSSTSSTGCSSDIPGKLWVLLPSAKSPHNKTCRGWCNSPCALSF